MSDEIETHPRDFLRRFGGGERPTVKEEPVKEVELSLGLYLGRGGGGGFSGDNKGLIRSSSLYTFPKKEEEVYRESPAMASAHTLIRACSLPVETGDVQRKREELQSLRRLEAKRKREERRSLRLRAEENGAGGATDVTSSSSTHRRKRVPDYDFQPMQGLDITRCSAKKPSPSPPAKQSSPPVWSPAEIDMPCVSAKGDGPNGKRIDGFLYKYSKGEEVRIMCVCHGSFLNPTEFVKHAGGGDVEYPLRHIVVHPSSSQTFL